MLQEGHVQGRTSVSPMNYWQGMGRARVVGRTKAIKGTTHEEYGPEETPRKVFVSAQTRKVIWALKVVAVAAVWIALLGGLIYLMHIAFRGRPNAVDRGRVSDSVTTNDQGMATGSAGEPQDASSQASSDANVETQSRNENQTALKQLHDRVQANFEEKDKQREAHDGIGNSDSQSGFGSDSATPGREDQVAETPAVHRGKIDSPSYEGTCYLSLRQERVCVLSPFCVEVNGQGVATPVVVLDPDKDLSCFRLRKHREVTSTGQDRCDEWLRQFVKEADFSRPLSFQNRSWFEALTWNNKSVYVDAQPAAFLNLMAASNANIAHFSGRIGHLFHVMQNLDLYGFAGKKLRHIALLGEITHQKMMHVPGDAQYDNWHMRLAQVLGDNEIPVELGFPMSRFTQPGVHFLGGHRTRNFRICWKNAVLPAFLKGRMFVSADELQAKADLPENAIGVPLDAIALRKGIGKVVFDEEKLPDMKRRLVLLARGRTRVFEAEDQKALEKQLEDLAKSRGWEYETVSFENKPFTQQLDSVKNAAVAVGIHGANLVNTIFMPPHAGLVEIFPYGFAHGMYERGLNSGLRYASVDLTTEPERPPYLENHENSVTKCVRENPACKLYYRSDRRKVPISAADVRQIVQEVELMMKSTPL
ncbi:EGF domain-specific O-linked N-acetylglucosamine transferase [Porphyridium purpureum]|uniref:EGF domain-specific O-linked N-acetylglucosamine transferase n=1 Tax=Porphyridium purpureum TaxID=35688 RepID=A0A5J4YQY1_PORPP|nr:EGF domain-specific O-linked N-acetylglucosamine transferase [Porphyridium purpureum]|eukprot:POR1088..scf222_8